MPKLTAIKVIADLGPVVTKAGKATPTTVKMLKGNGVAQARRSKTAKAIVQEVVLKNPIQVRHLRAEIQPIGKNKFVGTDVMTACGRIVCKQMTRKSIPTGRTVKVCEHCVDEDHIDLAFQSTDS